MPKKLEKELKEMEFEDSVQENEDISDQENEEKNERNLEEDTSDSDIENEPDVQIFITNNEEIKEQRFSWRTLLTYLFILGGALLFIITASLDPRDSNILYITGGVFLGLAFLLMIYYNL